MESDFVLLGIVHLLGEIASEACQLFGGLASSTGGFGAQGCCLGDSGDGVCDVGDASGRLGDRMGNLGGRGGLLFYGSGNGVGVVADLTDDFGDRRDGRPGGRDARSRSTRVPDRPGAFSLS